MPSSVSEPALVDPERAGRLVAWLGAALRGQVEPAAAIAAVEAGSHGHVVAGWVLLAAGAPLRVADQGEAAVQADAADEATLADTWPSLVTVGVERLSLALPVPGDPLGLVASDPFGLAALDAGAAMIMTTARGRIGWVPQPDHRGSSYRGWRWTLFGPAVATPAAVAAPAIDATARPLGEQPDDAVRAVEQADRALTRALRDATQALAGLDLAHWRADVALGRADAEAALLTAGSAMPPGWPPASRALAERALALWRVVRVAQADPGAVSASASLARAEALRALSHSVREAAMVAYNVCASTIAGARPAARGETPAAGRLPS